MLENVVKTAKINPQYTFSLNISALDIEDYGIQQNLFDTLVQENLTQQIVLEVLESEEFRDATSLSRFVQKAQQLGIALSIDDFGSGYANFANLIEVHYDYIKIDGSLIKNILENTKYELMVTQIVEFAKNVHSKTVAEFVENEAVAKKLEELGVDMLQGYIIGKPSLFGDMKDIL
jgi:EAL domain-containing protein (putative c-di-GMP-specific phosphodiesterase class I)